MYPVRYTSKGGFGRGIYYTIPECVSNIPPWFGRVSSPVPNAVVLRKSILPSFFTSFIPSSTDTHFSRYTLHNTASENEHTKYRGEAFKAHPHPHPHPHPCMHGRLRMTLLGAFREVVNNTTCFLFSQLTILSFCEVCSLSVCFFPAVVFSEGTSVVENDQACVLRG